MGYLAKPGNFDLISEISATESTLDHVFNLLFQLEGEHRKSIDNDQIRTFPIYRGEPEIYQTTLIPSIFRKPEKFNDMLFESKIVNQYLSKHPTNISKLAQLGSMQHYGFPTRLLDWSKNINVALYFAVFNNLEKDGVIYIFLPSLCCAGSTQPMEFFNEKTLMPYVPLVNIPHNSTDQIKHWNNGLNKMQHDKSVPLLIPWCFVLDNNIFSKDVNVRQSAQDAFFTFHVGYMDGNQYRIIPEKIQNDFNIAFVAQKVSRVIIPAKLKQELAIKLLNMNISTKTLFPEVPVYNEVEYSLER